MKWIVMILAAILMLTHGGPILAQDSTSALTALGYPSLTVTTDGASLALPDSVSAGRYLLSYDGAASNASTQVTIVGPVAGQTADQLIADIQAMDLSFGPPEWYRSLPTLGGAVSGQTTAVELPPGEWVAMGLFFGNASSWALAQKVTVTGTLPVSAPIAGAVSIQIGDGTISAPDTLPAGPQVIEFTNTGSETHGLSLVMTSGPLTQEEAAAALVNALTGGAMMQGDGSATDTWTWTDMGTSMLVSPGVTTWLGFDLQPGTYIVYCYQQDASGAHAALGEVHVFTVA